MIECAKMANAHEFVSKLAEGYDTLIGEKGEHYYQEERNKELSLHVHLIRKQSNLLLDEATSALDTQSEKIVQEAFEKSI
ncbi:hypothetical protein, conserved [Entamoeba histolytica]